MRYIRVSMAQCTKTKQNKLTTYKYFFLQTSVFSYLSRGSPLSRVLQVKYESVLNNMTCLAAFNNILSIKLGRA